MSWVKEQDLMEVNNQQKPVCIGAPRGQGCGTHQPSGKLQGDHSLVASKSSEPWRSFLLHGHGGCAKKKINLGPSKQPVTWIWERTRNFDAEHHSVPTRVSSASATVLMCLWQNQSSTKGAVPQGMQVLCVQLWVVFSAGLASPWKPLSGHETEETEGCSDAQKRSWYALFETL